MRRIYFDPFFSSSPWDALRAMGRLSEALDGELRGSAAAADGPLYEIESDDEDHYRITLPIPGFAPDEIEVEAQGRALVVRGRRKGEAGSGTRGYPFWGRDFTRRFELAEHVEVKAARLENGVLEIALERELPDALKPRRIPIEGSAVARLGQKARTLIGNGRKAA